MVTIDQIKGITIVHKTLGKGQIVDLKNDFLYIKFGEQIKGFKLPLAFEGLKTLLTSNNPLIKKLIKEIKIRNSTCCLCGQVDLNIKSYKDQLLCSECYSEAENCQQCGRKVLKTSLSFKEADMCGKCFDEHYFKCDICGEFYPNCDEAQSEIIPEDQRWCGDCISTCDICEREFKKKDLIRVNFVYELCSDCSRTHLKKCRKCKCDFIAKNKSQLFCNDCSELLKHMELLSTIDLSEYLYVSYYYYEFVESRTVKLMSRLNGSCMDDPFDILFISSCLDEKLVIVYGNSKLYNSKATKKYYDTCTLTEFKKSNLFYELINKEMNVISTVGWSEDEVIDIWLEPVWLRAQTYADMDYRKEWEGGDLVYEGNNYGDTSNFYIIGKTRTVSNKVEK